MLPDPLHPAVVHLPIALAVVVPLLAVGGLFAIRSGFLPARAWLVVVLLQALAAGSAWVAVETGEEQEERVVAEEHIEEHEEAAEWFSIAATVTALIAAAGLLPNRIGRAGRAVAVLASLGVLAAAVRVGHLGGELVYRHGAADAYMEAPAEMEHEP